MCLGIITSQHHNSCLVNISSLIFDHIFLIVLPEKSLIFTYSSASITTQFNTSTNWTIVSGCHKTTHQQCVMKSGLIDWSDADDTLLMLRSFMCAAPTPEPVAFIVIAIVRGSLKRCTRPWCSISCWLFAMLSIERQLWTERDASCFSV